VTRSILENCKNVAEALALIKDMPIAYNLNMIVADKWGNAALIETVDGIKAIKQIDTTRDEKHLCATNHVVLPKLKEYEPVYMKNSSERNKLITKLVESNDKISSNDLKEILLTKYPNGLCVHAYNEFFGTTKSIVMDLNEGSIDICWAGLKENGFKKYFVKDELEEGISPLKINMEKSQVGFFDMVNR
jgi:predicted choloylglycine hydrolase